jgi:hypothetical protein
VFFGTIAVFPLGTPVLLNSGETALVTRVNKKFPTRPVVRVFKNRTGAKVFPPFEIDLAKNPAYFIQKILANDEP